MLKHTVEEAYENLSKKYGEELTKDEIELVESFSNDDSKAERKFNELKEGLIKKITTEMEKSESLEKKRWEDIRKNVSEKVYNKKTALIDVAEMLEAASVIEG